MLIVTGFLGRTARVDVVDPATGQRLRLPIVDLGPSGEQEAKGIAADFTPLCGRLFNNQGSGKKLLFEVVDYAGPDHKTDRALRPVTRVLGYPNWCDWISQRPVWLKMRGTGAKNQLQNAATGELT
jgi:hypothetical protein